MRMVTIKVSELVPHANTLVVAEVSIDANELSAANFNVLDQHVRKLMKAVGIRVAEEMQKRGINLDKDGVWEHQEKSP